MTVWSFDMSKCPRGRYVLIPVGKGAKGTRKVFEPAKIIAAGACGTVSIGHYLPDEKRFAMFTAEQPPIAWMPFDGPRAVAIDGKTRHVVDLPEHPTKATSWFQDLLSSRRAAA